MNSKIAPAKEPQFLFLLSLLAFLELSISGAVTLLISPDPKNALIFGFSAQRLLLVAGIWILAIIVLAAGVMARKKKMSLDSAWLVNKNKYFRKTIYGISFALIVWGWLSIVCPAYLFGKIIYIFERTQPFSVAVGGVLPNPGSSTCMQEGGLVFVALASSSSKLLPTNFAFCSCLNRFGNFHGFHKVWLAGKTIMVECSRNPIVWIAIVFHSPFGWFVNHFCI